MTLVSNTNAWGLSYYRKGICHIFSWVNNSPTGKYGSKRDWLTTRGPNVRDGINVNSGAASRAGLLQAWLVLTSDKYHGNL